METIYAFYHTILSDQINTTAFIVILFLTILSLGGRRAFPDSEKIKHYIRQSPSILATIGIFFSFLGISIGLMGFNPDDIQNSIPKLLDGLKVKFIASLMGIFASIIVRIAQSFNVEQKAVETSSDEKIIELLVAISETLSANAKNNPETLLQELKLSIQELPQEFRKQSVLLDSIKTSLAGEGDASVTTQLTKVRMDMKDALKEIDSNNNQRSELLNITLTAKFDSLSQKFDDFARIVAENNSKAFIEALEKAMRDFNNNITEQFGENFKELNRAVGELLRWQDNYRTHVEQLTNNFEVALNGITSIQNAFSDIQIRSQSFTEVSAELSGILQKMDTQLQELNYHLKTLDQVADSAKQAFPMIEENLTKLTVGFKKATEQSLADINSTVESVGENMAETTKKLKETTGKMRDSMEGQKETLDTTSQEFKEVVGVALKSLAKEIKASIDVYQASLQEVVTEQLNSINENIKQGNNLINSAIQDARTKFEQSVTETGDVLKASTQDVADQLKATTNTMKLSMATQQEALSSTGKEFKDTVNRTLSDLSQETQLSIKNYQSSLQKAVSDQLESIGSHVKQNNEQIKTTLQNASAEYEKSIKTQAAIVNGTITEASNLFNKSIQDTAKNFEYMAETIAESIDDQEKTLKNVSQDVKASIDKTLRDLTEQSKLSIKDYERNLHDLVSNQFSNVTNSVNLASKEFNRLLTENTTKSTSILEQQTQKLDQALQDELKKAIETMGKHLAALSNQFVKDYTPLTERLKEVVKLADELKRGR